MRTDWRVPINFINMEAEMDFGSINWLAVVACVVASLIIGSIWFSEKVFFPMWWVAIGRKPGETPGMTGGGAMVQTFGLTILASFIQATFMSLMVTALVIQSPGGKLQRNRFTKTFYLGWK